MEPLDPFKNEGSSGPYKRRISSILKAPRKSIKLPDPEQQENVVDCAKPVDKRNSRRVSFAPANDVLLFSKDAKNVSPVRSPLQELMTATAADIQNSVQFAVTENGIQQITGMETLLKAPLHASQQRDMVNANAGVDLGEKTMLFFTEDASVDMTYCHTINIASDVDILEDIPLHNYHILPTGGEKMVMFPADGGSMVTPSGSASLPSSRSMDLKAENKNTASSVLPLDPGFESFLASLSQPSRSSVNPAVPRTSLPAGASSGVTTQRKTQQADIDKENQAPSFVPDVFEKTMNASLALFPEDDLSMDMTEAQTGCIQAITDKDENPFQFLFPSREMYSQNDSKESLTAENNKQQQSRRTLPASSSKDMTPLQKPFLPASLPQHLTKADTEDGCSDKTIRFTASDDFMDMTQSQTVNIASSLFPPPNKTLDVLPAGKEVNRVPSQRRKTESSSTHGVDLEFKNSLASLSKVNGPGGNPANTRGFPLPPKQMYPKGDSVKRAEITSGHKNRQDQGSSKCAGLDTSLTASLRTKQQNQQVQFDSGDDSRERTLRFSANDAAMDVTSHTVNITTNFVQQPHQHEDYLPICGEKTVRFTTDDADMDFTRSLTVNIGTNVKPKSHQMMDVLPPGGEKTLRFSADDAAMDETRSHTANIAASLESQQQKNMDFVPASGEKTVRFSADDAAMDVTRSLTVNINTSVEPKSHQMTDFLPPGGEKTLRFSADDAAMDVTRSLTVNINTSVEPKSHQMTDFLPPGGEKTLRFSADDAAMDVTKSHTANIATNIEPQLQQPAIFSTTCGEKKLRFSENDAAMDVTQCHTVNIANNSDYVLSHQESNILSTPDKDFPFSEKRTEMEPGHLRKTRSFTTHSLDIGLRKSLPRKSAPFAYSCIPKASLQEAAHSIGFEDQLSQRNDVETETSAFVSSEIVVNKTMTEDVTKDMAEAQTSQILRQTDEDVQGLKTQDINSNPVQFGKKEVMSQNHEAPESSRSTGDQVSNRPESLNSNESDTWKESEPRLQTLSSHKTESSPVAVDHDESAAPSRKSRRMSLADLHSKIRRLSQMISTAPETADMDSVTAHNGDQSPKDRTQTLPVMEPEPETSLTNPYENTQAQNQIQEEQSFSPITTTPFNLKTRQLISRLSVSTFKAKLPQRPRPEDQKRVNSIGEHTRTMPLDITNQLNNFDADVSDINDEELGSLEDASETIDTRTPQKTSRPLSPSGKSHMEEHLEYDDFEQDFMSGVCGRKRPLLEEENSMEEDEKRMKGSTEVDAVFLSPAERESADECEGNFPTAPITSTQNTDYSNISHTGSRCEATFESTFKHSLFESQLEEYASDIQAKFDDGTITVLEFFKVFSIDFVIHTPRQSVNPGKLMSDCSPMDLLKDRHIVRPKQMVYESDVRNLTEKVEGLKVRMQDLDKPLRVVNRALWEEMRTLSEKELKSFGAKLKERNNFFRKTSKVQSHEMKEVLYSQIVQADLEEQQKLRERIKEADEMMKSLDECIHELETELAAVEDKGSEDRPGLKSCKEELQKVTEALVDTERQTSELEMQKTQNLNKITRLKSETRNLENHISMLNMVTEWRFGEKTDDYTVYTFLHKTFHLQLGFHKSNRCDAEKQSERKISDIKFTLQLDGEKSEDHACLVHKLLSQYFGGEATWVKRYPTSRHVPKLLHDVSLVVSRCRLLGEEVRLLKMWGSVRLNILSISCVDTQVLIVFSSLKTFSKFEVIFSISLTNQLCVLQVQDFRNMIGSTTIEQIEEIVASFSAGKNQLTKIVKKINEKLL